MEPFASNLKKLREEKVITLDTIARDTGINKGVLSRYENNKREPNITNIKVLADYFGINVYDLMGWKD